MITANNVQTIKLGSKITIFNGIYAILLVIFYISLFPWIMKEKFNAIDKIWTIFNKYNPEISGLYIKSSMLSAVFIIALGICIIYLSYFILKRKDKTAWIILFVIGIILWPCILLVDILNKNIFLIVLSFIGWLMFIIGMLIPIKYYLQKGYNEY
jgi:hypothetical protein